MRMLLKISIATAVVATWLIFVAGCGKSPSTNCEYIVTPWVQVESKDMMSIVTEGIIGYGFYADTAQWTVASYEDAIAGIIKNRHNDQTRNADFIVKQDSIGVLRYGPFTHLKAIVIACDTTNRLYAWRHAELVEGLPSVRVPIHFLLWKQAITYDDSRWTVVNQYFVPTPEPDPDPEPEPTPDPEPDPVPTSGSF